jgi:hypothetical protein
LSFSLSCLTFGKVEQLFSALKENKKTENVGEIENCQKPHKESVELNEQSHVGSEIEDSKLHVDSKEVNPQNMDSKDNIENISTNTSDRAISKHFTSSFTVISSVVFSFFSDIFSLIL